MTSHDWTSTLPGRSTSLAPTPSHLHRVHRAREILTAVGRAYPHAWKIVDQLRAERGKTLPLWPDWCFLPVNGTYAPVFREIDNLMLYELAVHMGVLGALAAWRVTQGIYRFDSELYEAVAVTELDRAVPSEALYRLPEWCVYIETPGLVWELACEPRPIYGVWAHLDWKEREPEQPRDELHLVFDMARSPAEVFDSAYGCLPIVLTLGKGTLMDALDRSVAINKEAARKEHGITLPDWTGNRHTLAKILQVVVSLLLYLCSEEPEIGDGNARPGNPSPKRTKAGWRLFPPDRPTTWDVGVRLGAALRRAHLRVQAGDTSAELTSRSSPRAHIRRAHWHTFLAGAGRSERRLKWLPPIGVNIEDLSGLPSVIRQVTDESH